MRLNLTDIEENLVFYPILYLLHNKNFLEKKTVVNIQCKNLIKLLTSLLRQKEIILSL